MTNQIQKTISVCIIGRPNSGKSTLLNRIIGEKLSIVTPKVQTTRSIITGIVTLKDTQIILYDTPGIFEPKGMLEKAMVRCAWSSVYSADLVLSIIDSLKPLDNIAHNILNQFCLLNIVPIFLLNKIDIESKYLNDIKAFLKITHPKSLLFPISALLGKNVDVLLEYIKSKAKVSPWLYADDDITNLPMRFIAAEITREQLFLNLQQELPYKLTVQTEKFEELKDKSIKINQVIVISRENYKAIILGKNGAKIKDIGVKSRVQLEQFFCVPVHLFLFVKVHAFWENNQEFYQYMKI
ncbi:GTPase Era [Rickettsia prowazekii]|uniref:GTPase Era n=2 Tax=Rickettsia prowazekii TaxID=782 RepID=ERA_RICPR|nr:GTPase Era [Rickettsia prowazekii]Q9ZE30.1 RecName: Full=GTPase Era [Rickettsia prowazekii str. Madrid E]EOB10007.1 GTPase Era [Rickettsia prowazekii str. GvF12]ADE29626.1 GTP-binding protein Era [Rickettsia prowazekii str. Rp22]AFE48942.1 GTPase Era [Rickettsia prowazekii str. Chernikova]AFE49787.1 GTPase Era [Rickettsia prowazekii str. Katsinyian]AFE50631.1 GTPase Era [Rickettsia prowazekii str. BuV67-CWPP]